MIDNVIIVSARDNIACPIVVHCRTLSLKKTTHYFVVQNNKGLDNFVFNDNSDND